MWTIYQDMGLLILDVPCDNNGVINEVTYSKLLEVTEYMIVSGIKEVNYGLYFANGN